MARFCQNENFITFGIQQLLVMPKKITLKAIAPTEERMLKTLVENRSVYSLNSCELNVFETFKAAAAVPLTFGDFVVTSMLRGKKVMHLFDKPGFEYLPGETVLVPAHVTMKIDFPEATHDNPTQCIALALDNNKIQQIVNRLNEDYPKDGTNDYWRLHHNEYHFQNNQDLANTINKVIDICYGKDPSKDILADLALREMVVRIIQSQHLTKVESADAFANANSNPLSFVLNFIRLNIGQQFQMEQLSNLSCMSMPTFYRVFKREFGISPLDYILREKIKKAKQMMQITNLSLTEIGYELGFTSLNYFDRQFKRIEGISPKQYRQLLQQKRPIN
ncbi:MAG: hypothetical protein RLY16_1139 [Bacteroidota bacterium]